MKKNNCEECKLRAKYDKNSKSLLSRFWRWHIGFCPGWKSYTESLDEEKRHKLRIKYRLKK